MSWHFNEQDAIKIKHARRDVQEHACTHIKHTTYKNKIYAWDVSVCVQLISSKQIKHIEVYLWCLSTLRTWEGLELEYQSLKLPLHTIPNTWFVYEISQSRYGNPYNLPLWLFRDKTTTHIDSSQQNRNYGSTMIFYFTKRYIKIILKSSISCRSINPWKQSFYTFQFK